MSPDMSPKQSQQQQQHLGSSNLGKRSKVSRPVEPSFAESMHKSIKLSPPHVGLDSGKPERSVARVARLKLAAVFFLCTNHYPS